MDWQSLFKDLGKKYNYYKKSPVLYGPFGYKIGLRKNLTGNWRTKKRKATSRFRFGKPKGAPYSKSSGKLKKGSKVRKYKKKAVMKYATVGTNKTIESSKVQEGTNTVWVGHATFARDNIMRQAVVSILYKFFVDQQLIRDATFVNDAIASIPATSTLTVWYRTSTSASSASEVFTAGASTSLSTIADWWMNPGRAWATSIGGAAKEIYDIEFLEIVFSIGTIVKTMLLTDTKIHVYVKSALKMQNRTKAAATGDTADDADQIDNVPLYGKSYSGRGTGLLTKLPYYGELFCDRQFGTIVGSETVRSEPPQPRDFVNVKNCGKAHLDPGDIKTSVITSKFNMFFNTLVRHCAPGVAPSVPAPATTYLLQNFRRRDLGTYRVFCLEKMIDVGAGDNIRVAFENNMEISCKATIIKRKVGVLKEFQRFELA